MFRGLINDAKAAASSIVLKYVARASVAVPFVIAVGFGLAATTVFLVERYGQQTAYWIMAGGLAAIGLVATLFVSVKEQEEEVADETAEANDTSNVASEMAAQAPLALVGGLLSLPGGPSTLLKVAKVLGKNFPLVLLLVVIGALFWPTKETAAAEGEMPYPVPPPETDLPRANTVVRNGRSAWLGVFAIALGVGVATTAVFFAAPAETQHAVISMIGWK